MDAKVLKFGPPVTDNQGIISKAAEGISAITSKVWQVSLGVSHGVEDVSSQDSVSQRGELRFDLVEDGRWHEYFT